MKSNHTTNRILQKWTKKAGLTKHVTFHMSRHTCGTLLHTYGVDIYTISKLLNHSSIQPTQIYAKVVDRMKDEAVDKMPVFN